MLTMFDKNLFIICITLKNCSLEKSKNLVLRRTTNYFFSPKVLSLSKSSNKKNISKITFQILANTSN